jgi:hypothetical protein
MTFNLGPAQDTCVWESHTSSDHTILSNSDIRSNNTILVNFRCRMNQDIPDNIVTLCQLITVLILQALQKLFNTH